MEARKWEELPIDCMVDILGRVGLESLLIDVPFVCKSWYKATLNPLCWKQLDFPNMFVYLFDDPFIIRFERQYGVRGDICLTKFVKGVVDRSAGCATTVMLPSGYSKEPLITYVADKCPALKLLVIRSSFPDAMSALPFVIGKLKNLEGLGIQYCGLQFNEIITAVGAHCENFAALSLDARSLFDNIGEDEVMAIVSCLPKIKRLALNVFIERENLIKLLKGCRELEYLDVGYCGGFVENDVEISKLASHIPKFKCSGTVLHFNDICDGSVNGCDADLDDEIWKLASHIRAFKCSSFVDDWDYCINNGDADLDCYSD